MKEQQIFNVISNPHACRRTGILRTALSFRTLTLFVGVRNLATHASCCSRFLAALEMTVIGLRESFFKKRIISIAICLTVFFLGNVQAQKTEDVKSKEETSPLTPLQKGGAQNSDDVKAKGRRQVRQALDDVANKSQGCLTCHRGTENMHESPVVKLGCTDCHGGNPLAKTLDMAHVKPTFSDVWKSSANPKRSFTVLNEEKPEFIKFVNPGDLRVAEETCGACHPQEVLNVKKSMMTTSILLFGGAAYNNGIVSNKVYNLGESYGRDGTPQRINTVPPPTAEEIKNKGVLPFVLPLPRWEISQVTDMFRTFERGGKIPRINPSNIGVPALEDPGRPDMKVGDRGLGTQLRISSPVLNLHKTRLNDPHLSFMGTNDQPGDYRSGGCTACHVVYANDRSPVHSGAYAKYGNTGYTATADKAIPKKQEGHPIRHQFTRSIPSSQCMTCHMHQPNAFLNTFYGFQMWDYETDGQAMYPEKQQEFSADEKRALLERNPEEAVLRGKWADRRFLANVSKLNPKLEDTQFSDYHGHGWIFRAVFKKDRKGNLLDKDDNIIAENSEHKFHGVVPLAGSDSFCDDACRIAQKAVHLKDIHLEKGMQCIDCHFERDVHSNGKLYGEFHNAIEIQCADCHGTVNEFATFKTSGVAAPEGGTDLTLLQTPFRDARFEMIGDKRIQRSMMSDALKWEISQVRDSIDPNSSEYNPKSYAAKLIAKGGDMQTADGIDEARLAHASEKMECQSCHTSWITNCFGCHLPQQANWKKSMNHFEGDESRNWTTYNPQVVRDDGFMLCISGTTKGNKITTARSSSALVLSSKNANREQIYLQQPPVSAPGYSSQAFNPHFAHTVRKAETRTCTDCHVSSDNDNNAWMAQLLLQGTNFVNFMGKYAYVAEGQDGLEAAAVTEDGEPQAVIGSYLQKLAYPDNYKKHLAEKQELQTAHHHGGDYIRSLQLRGEYLYTANGADGFRVYDVANIDNKAFSERVVSAPVSPFGQDTQVKTKFATAVALPTNMPINTKRKAALENPDNQEKPLHPLYTYAYITDKFEGLILVDVMTLADGDPTNNFLKRAVTFNPRGILNGARNLAIAGNYVYVLCQKGLVVVSIDDPLNPEEVSTISSPELNDPRSIAIQFRYAFVCDENGVKVIDITDPESPQIVSNSFVPLQQAMDIYCARTYAYVAAGRQGLVIVDIEKPDSIFIAQKFTANGKINDARGVKVASTNASLFAYVADGKNGLRVVQLASPLTPGHLGFSPPPQPLLIATHPTRGPALAISKGLDRDRAVDESGNQVSIFGRIGSRPFTLDEQRAFYINEAGEIYTVSDDDWKQFVKKDFSKR